MVSGVPKPQVLAIWPIDRLVVSSSLQADSSRTASTWSAAVTPDLGLEDPAELTFGQVDLTCERSHGQVVREVVAQPGQQVVHRRRVCGLRGQEARELGLAARPLQVDDESPGNRGGGAVAMVVRDEREREVDAGGDAGRRPHVAVADVDGVGVHSDAFVALTQESARVPVGGCPTTLQQTGSREDESA